MTNLVINIAKEGLQKSTEFNRKVIDFCSQVISEKPLILVPPVVLLILSVILVLAARRFNFRARFHSFLDGINARMTTPYSRFCGGFLYGSSLGCALFGMGITGSFVSALVGIEGETGSISELLLGSLYVISFGLSGGAMRLLQYERARLYASSIAMGAAVVILLLSIGVMFCVSLDVKQPGGWCWGAGGTLLLCFMLSASLIRLRLSWSTLRLLWRQSAEKRGPHTRT